MVHIVHICAQQHISHSRENINKNIRKTTGLGAVRSDPNITIIMSATLKFVQSTLTTFIKEYHGNHIKHKSHK